MNGYFTFPPTCLSTALTSSYVSFPSPFASIDSIIAPRSFIEIWRCANFNSPKQKIDLQKFSQKGVSWNVKWCILNYHILMLPFDTNPSLFLSIMLNTSSEIIGAVIKSCNRRLIDIYRYRTIYILSKTRNKLFIQCILPWWILYIPYPFLGRRLVF